MRRPAALLAALVLLGAPAGVALGQVNPLGPLPPAPTSPQQTVVVAPNTNSNDGGGLKDWQELLIFAAGIILLSGIAYAIVSDARSKAPVKDSELGHPGVTQKANRSQKQRERARAKAKTGRQQRKRNRRR